MLTSGKTIPKDLRNLKGDLVIRILICDYINHINISDQKKCYQVCTLYKKNLNVL